MGKGNELWDDSALINAFDHAMLSYKVIHTKPTHGNSPEEVSHPIDANENNAVSTEMTEEEHLETEDSNNISSNAKEAYVSFQNIKTSIDDPLTQEICANLHAPESHLDSSGDPITNGKPDGYSDQQSMEYDQLLRQYYELEEKRNNILQQLYQANNWSYPTPVQTSTSQAHQALPYNGSECGLHNPGSLCSGHYVAVPLASISACASNGLSCGGYFCCPSGTANCFGSQANQVPVKHAKHSKEAENSIEVGLMAAEKAISSMKKDICATSNVCEGKEKSSGISEDSGLDINSETDLSAVFNAWYLAGFHTGRYLSGKSKKNVQL